MNSTAEVHEIELVARRPDGSRVAADEVLAYLDSVRVAAGVVDGARLGRLGVHTVRMALTEDELVVRSDDLPATLEWRGLVRSLVHRFATVALLDDGVVGPDGRHHRDDLPDELRELIDDASTLEEIPTTCVHVVRTDPDLDSDAQSIANSGRATVEVVHLDGFTLIRDTISTDPGVVVDVALRSQLPAVALRREGDARSAVVRMRQGRRTIVGEIERGVPAEVTDVSDPATRALLVGDVLVTFGSRRRPDDALRERLQAAGTGETSFAHDVAAAVGVPIGAATWLEDEVAPGPVTVLGPLSRREMLAQGVREFTDDMRSELSREALTQGPLGGFRRFLLDHPVVTLLYGLAELWIAYLLVTAIEPWPVVRWIVAGYVALEGLMSLGIGATTLRRRVRA